MNFPIFRGVVIENDAILAYGVLEIIPQRFQSEALLAANVDAAEVISKVANSSVKQVFLDAHGIKKNKKKH